MTKRVFKVIYGVVLLTFLGLVFTTEAVFAESSITINTSTDHLDFQMLPGTYDTESQTITVSTNSEAGYTVTLKTAGSSSSLIHQENTSLVIPTFTLPSGSETIPAASVGFGYGYSIDNGANFYDVPEPSDSPRVLFKTSTGGTNTHTLTFGVKTETNTTAGTYDNSFIIQAVANLEPCPEGNICYYGNDDDGTGEMSNQPASSNSSTMLMPSNFSRDGYGFAGWNTSIDGSGTTYGPSQTITTGDLSQEGLQLYAKWIPSTGNLQKWGGCSALEINEVVALTDTRDDSTYAVAKLADEKCWMIENLRLDFSDPDLVFNSTNTNKPASSFVSAINTNPPVSTNTTCESNTAACIDQILYNTNNTNRNFTPSYNASNTTSSWYSYGNYYNWYTATAGNGTRSMSVSGTPVSGDICPAGWKLPAGYGSAGDTTRLDLAMNGTGQNYDFGTTGGIAASQRWRSYPLNYILSGEQRTNKGYNRGVATSYATSNTSSTERALNIWLKQDGIFFNSNNTQKYRGQTVRCIINESYKITGNIHYDANGGIGTMSDEINVDFETTVAANNLFTKNYADFLNWNTSPDGRGVVVAEGGEVSSAANSMGISDGETLTLYAIWKNRYNLVYEANANSEEEGSMLTADVSSLVSGNLVLAASNYSRAGYGFAGWSFDSDAATKLANNQDVAIYGPNETIRVDSSIYSKADSTNTIRLYAVWIPQDTTYTLQTFGTSECSALGVNKVLALRDERDGNIYSVSKLADNHCWMTENLRLLPSVTTLNSTNTNSPTTTFLTLAASSSTTDTMCNTDNTGCVDQVLFNSNNINRSYPASRSENLVGRSWYSYGVMYNWYTASAGNGDFAMESGNVVGDICPKGWRLPTGGPSGEYMDLDNALNGIINTDATEANAPRLGHAKFPANFLYSGDFNYNKPGGRNSFGRYWSATPNSTLYAYRYGVMLTGSTPDGSWNKWDAFSVRCIVK